MLRIYAFLVTLAVASAAPQFYWGRPPPPPPPPDHGRLSMDRFFQDDVFDTNRFWGELKTAHDILEEFEKHFTINESSEKVVGDKYVVTVSLPDFEEKDIIVKANKGSLLIQAVHEDGGRTVKNYLQYKTLPTNVGDDGIWSYDNGVLKIEFPVGKTEVTTEAIADTTEEAVTKAADKSREEMEESNSQEEAVDADVGLTRGDNDAENEILTNEIPKSRVEATTYSIRSSDDVEFVPMKY